MQDQIKDIDRLLDMREFSNLILENLAKIGEEEFTVINCCSLVY